MEGTLLYDADCGFCTRVAHRLPALRLPIEIAPMQAADLQDLGVSPERSTREMPFVGADGTGTYGHAAFGAALRTGSLPCRAVGRLIVLGPMDGLFRRVYTWVARHRHELPGGTAGCELPEQ